MPILAIDAGTTGVTSLLIDHSGAILARGYCEFEQHFPQPGWVEHHPQQIWEATLKATVQALEGAGLEPNAVGAIGVTNQRETVAVWDRQTLQAVTPAIVWQDRRTSQLLTDAKFAEAADWVREATGLPLDPYFSSSKLLWMKRNLPEVWAGIVDGRYAVGTIDSYLVARISGGAAHITDATNASRTQLFNIRTMAWDSRLLELFEVPEAALPVVTPSWGRLATSSAEAFLGISATVTGCAGDQQAALFGQGCTSPGDAKCTYGTGAFLLQNTGEEIFNNDPRLLATVAYLGPNGERAYALEGSVFIAGAAIQWLRDGLGIIESAAEVTALAESVASSDGVFFVPALSGLGAPFWDPEVRGSLMGLTRGTGRGHIARATLEAIAFSVRALVDAMSASGALPIRNLKVDGGASANSLLMQLQADVIGAEVIRPANLETTALGAAHLAAIGAGVWVKPTDAAPAEAKTFQPLTDIGVQYRRWLEAVAATRAW